MESDQSRIKPVTVPDHGTLDRRLLRKIMRDEYLNLEKLLDLFEK